MEKKKISISEIQEMKRRGEKITSITAYDYPFARLVDEAGFDVVFVGDSLGMVCLGYESTVTVTMEEVLHHLRPVARTCKRAHVVGDMPYGTYFQSNEQAIMNATKLMQGGADSVKMEGGGATLQRIKAVVDAGIPCWGHLGVTPQFIALTGGYRTQGKDLDTAKRLMSDSLKIQNAGAWALQLECVPSELSKLITERLRIPVFGAGCGPHVDGQGMNIYDALGLFDKFLPKMSKRYTNFWEQGITSLQEFHHEIKEGRFPTLDQSFTVPEEVMEKLIKEIES